MPRITLTSGLMQRQLANLAVLLRQASQATELAMYYADAITAGGLSPEAMEGTGGDTGIQVGQGAAVYAGLQTVRSALLKGFNGSGDAVQLFVSSIDQG